MTLDEREAVFVRIGGQQWEADAALEAVGRMNALERACLGAVVDDVKNSGNAAIFFGHLAEVNFAATFLEAGETLNHAVHQALHRVMHVKRLSLRLAALLRCTFAEGACRLSARVRNRGNRQAHQIAR